MLIGYARVATRGQNLDLQIESAKKRLVSGTPPQRGDQKLSSLCANVISLASDRICALAVAVL